jgi:2-octaprenyl-3-methyl-6-methoxy-1,4-benzoquinol hydroxylase
MRRSYNQKQIKNNQLAMIPMRKVEFAVVGGGMVGAATALGLAQQGRNVALIEPHPPQAFDLEQPMDLRISAISMASVGLLQQLGAWKAITQMRLCAYKGLETWEHLACKTSFSAAELGLEQLGYMVENRVVQLGLWQQFSSYPNLTLSCPDTIESIEFSETNVIRLSSGEEIVADWIIGADGANSKVRALANIGVTAWDYRHHCMLINVTTEHAQSDVTWQQFFPSGPRSYLPLLGNQASLVWYDSPQRIRQLSAMNAAQLKNEIEAFFPKQLGTVEVLDHGSFPLVRRHAQRYVSRRCVLVGDAAHTINPLAGQGVNLGFKDVRELLKQTDTEWSNSSLSQKAFVRYERIRSADNLVMQSGMDLFYKAFSNDITPLKVVRNLALKTAHHAGPLKKLALRYALGL